VYAMVTRWAFKTGSGEEAMDITTQDVMPAVEKQPGYVRSVVVRTGADSFVSVACWETEDDAKRAMAQLAPLVIRQLGRLVRDVERVSGTVVYE
jgi:heme-degrading monooxygenase HmoA